MTRAYSYLRFSSDKQLKGDSVRRQLAAVREYSDTHKFDLDERSFRDLGVSAYRGANAVEGALGQFIEAVDTGKIDRGSFLLVENLDRLSRDRIMPALNQFSSLLEKGITVVTLSDGKVYTEESLNNLPDLMLSLLTMSRAHEESELKSRRVKAAWQRKRDRAAQEGHKLTSRCPAWLEYRDGKFHIIKDRAAIVKRVYKLALTGHGKESIARKLNEDSVPPFGKSNGWYSSYIRTMLHTPAAIGQIQPYRHEWKDGKKRLEPDGPIIEDYYPAVVSEKDYYRVQAMRPGVSGKGRHRLKNVLAGIAFCADCGGKLHYLAKGGAMYRNKKMPVVAYLGCSNKTRLKKCTARNIRYTLAHACILQSLGDDALDVRDLIENSPTNGRKELRDRKETFEGMIAATDKAIANLLNALERVPSPALEKRLMEYEKQQEKRRTELTTVTNQLKDTATPLDNFNELEGANKLIKTLRSEDEIAIEEIFIRVNAAYKKVIDRAEFGYLYDNLTSIPPPAALGVAIYLHGIEEPVTKQFNIKSKGKNHE